MLTNAGGNGNTAVVTTFVAVLLIYFVASLRIQLHLSTSAWSSWTDLSIVSWWMKWRPSCQSLVWFIIIIFYFLSHALFFLSFYWRAALKPWVWTSRCDSRLCCHQSASWRSKEFSMLRSGQAVAQTIPNPSNYHSSHRLETIMARSAWLQV